MMKQVVSDPNCHDYLTYGKHWTKIDLIDLFRALELYYDPEWTQKDLRKKLDLICNIYKIADKTTLEKEIQKRRQQVNKSAGVGTLSRQRPSSYAFSSNLSNMPENQRHSPSDTTQRRNNTFQQQKNNLQKPFDLPNTQLSASLLDPAKISPKQMLEGLDHAREIHLQQLENYCLDLSELSQADLRSPYYKPVLHKIRRFVADLVKTYDIPTHALLDDTSPVAVASNCVILREILSRK